MIKSGSKFIQRSGLFLAILCSILASGLSAQTPQQTYSFALAQSHLGNDDLAIKSLKRLQFFDEQDQFPEVFRLLADCYYHKSDFENAFYYYDLATIQSDNDSLKAELTARKIACKLYDQQYQEALIELLSFNKDVDRVQQWQFNMLYGITYFYLNDYQQSQQYFSKCADSSLQEISTTLEYDFDRIKYLERRYNPRLARVMSIIIPGAGQVYGGDLRNGANSLLLISGILSAGAAMAGSLTFYDAAIIILPWFQRYYSGGYQKAFDITLAKQQAEKNKELIHIVSLLNQADMQ